MTVLTEGRNVLKEIDILKEAMVALALFVENQAMLGVRQPSVGTSTIGSATIGAIFDNLRKIGQEYRPEDL